MAMIVACSQTYRAVNSAVDSQSVEPASWHAAEADTPTPSTWEPERVQWGINKGKEVLDSLATKKTTNKDT